MMDTLISSDSLMSFGLGVAGFAVYEAFRYYSLRIVSKKKGTQYDLGLIVCAMVLALGAGLLAVFLVNGNAKGSFFVGLSSLSLLQMLAQTRHARNRAKRDSKRGVPFDDIGPPPSLTALERIVHRYFGHIDDEESPRIGI